MTKASLESVIDALVEIVDGWNDAAVDEDRGRSNDTLCLTLYDDGSGFLGRRDSYDGPDGERVNDIDDWCEFSNIEELVTVLESEGVEIET